MNQQIILIKEIKLLSIFLLLTTAVCATAAEPADQLLESIRVIMPKDPVILEAGGHFGQDTIRMKRLYPQATIHVFEPQPSSFDKMIRNTAKLDGVIAYPYALSDTIAKMPLYINSYNCGATSLGKPIYTGSGFIKEYIGVPLEIASTTIDEWARINQVNHVDLMWLDMEGHELSALRSSLSILPTVKAIYTEVNYIAIRENTGLYVDLKLFLEQQGFKEIWHKNFMYTTNEDGNPVLDNEGKNIWILGDALFVRSQYVRAKGNDIQKPKN